MTNFEFWKGTMLELTRRGENIAVKKGKPCTCSRTKCSDCELAGHISGCAFNLIKWLYAEHVEKPTLTKKERQFCELVGRGYITRDADGELDWYDEHPIKGICEWYVDVSCAQNLIRVRHLDLTFYIEHMFSFVKWTDEKPWSVEDLLKLKVEEEK